MMIGLGVANFALHPAAEHAGEYRLQTAGHLAVLQSRIQGRRGRRRQGRLVRPGADDRSPRVPHGRPEFRRGAVPGGKGAEVLHRAEDELPAAPGIGSRRGYDPRGLSGGGAVVPAFGNLAGRRQPGGNLPDPVPGWNRRRKSRWSTTRISATGPRRPASFPAKTARRATWLGPAPASGSRSFASSGCSGSIPGRTCRSRRFASRIRPRSPVRSSWV